MYKKYIGGIPFVDSTDIISSLSKIVKQYKIDAIYPTMDKVIWKLKSFESDLGCKVISSPKETTEICVSKKKTYLKLKSVIKTPKIFENIKDVSDFPVFIKPDIGYGSRNTIRLNSIDDVTNFFSKNDIIDYIISEYLEGSEYTVDCFTDRDRVLKFSGPRIRNRISNGISVNTMPAKESHEKFIEMAQAINSTLKMKGAWFFQVKKNKSNELVLLEVAARLGGSSSLYRGKGINFALLSAYDALGIDVDLLENDYNIEMDRALNNKYKIDIEYSTVYVDFDDCLIFKNEVNTQLISFLYACLNRRKKIILITKHEQNISNSLAKYRLNSLFDEVIHISKNENKADYITDSNSIFIDDSFQERKNIKNKKKIPVFSPDMIETIMN
ncbi:MAG: ATP-grasp domain-containing protein [Saprospiraceae bacterium]|nr:ATP-grasp domain-containing protein [Saprospiraceae bacterium]